MRAWFSSARVAFAVVALVVFEGPLEGGPSRAAPRAAADPFADCRQQLAGKPDEYDPAFCFFSVSYNSHIWDEGIRALGALMQQRPDNYWLPLVTGHIHRNRLPRPDPGAAESFYRRSAEGFARTHHVEGEIIARSNLRDLLVPLGRVADASREVARVKELGESTSDPLLRARAWMVEASHVTDTGGDLGLAYRLLKQTQWATAAAPYRLRRTALTFLGLVVFRMGRVDEAVTTFRELERISHDAGDIETEANAKYNILNTEERRADFFPAPGTRERLLQVAKETLAIGTTAGHRGVILKTHRTLASLLAPDRATRGDALNHARACIALATDAHQPHDEGLCSSILATLLYEEMPAAALSAQHRAAAAYAKANTPFSESVNAREHMRFSWLSRPHADAVAESLRALDAIEILRSLQDAPDSAAALFSTWTRDYYWFSGRLLQSGAEEDLTTAFSVTERMRARALLEMRDRARTTPDSASPLVADRRRLLREIASTQRTLMDPALNPDERQARLHRLERLEADEQEAQRRIAVADSAGARRPPFATIEGVQRALAPDEALLSFQVGISTTVEGEFGGGSWLLAITRDRRKAYPIPDRVHFAPLVPVFIGLLARGDGLEARPAVRLYGDVFSTALKDLAADIKRLIVVPDGPLQHLPFDALRADVSSPPLASRYQLVVAPSATLWLDWRAHPGPPPRQRALALADPEIGAGAKGDAAERGAFFSEGLALGRLPHAREESRAMARRLTGVDRLVGSDASERAFKSRDLHEYDVVHFAAHAIADESFPERSAVFLAAGDESEDGLLQAREITDLDLRDRIVVLSACRTAAGADLSGEGVLSLARAFFEAGARTVIGTRWPIRDADAAVLFDLFYAELGRGASVSEALARTKAQAITNGLRSDAWAALVLLGDGAVRPFPDVRSFPDWSPWIAVLAVAFIAVLVAGERIRRRASARRAEITKTI